MKAHYLNKNFPQLNTECIFRSFFFISPGLYSNHLGAGGILGLQCYYNSSIVFLIIEKKVHSLFSYLVAIIFNQVFTKTCFFTKNEK